MSKDGEKGWVPLYAKPELSIEECKAVLGRNGDDYSNDEIVEIRTLILNLVEIDFCSYQSHLKGKVETGKIIRLDNVENGESKIAA